MMRLSLLAVIASVLVGCSSAKPAKPVPLPVAAAERSVSQASKSSRAGNWNAAASQWQSAVDQYRLLNDRRDEAVALHNLAEAKEQLGDTDSAHRFLEEASAIN